MLHRLNTLCYLIRRKRYETMLIRYPKCSKTASTSRRIDRLRERAREFSRIDRHKVLGIAIFVLTVAGAVAPRSIVLAQRLEFDVASIKLNLIEAPPGFRPQRSGGLVTMHNTRVSAIFSYAYNIAGSYQVAGFPDQWDWYDIDARTREDATEEQIRLMFQSLLED